MVSHQQVGLGLEVEVSSSTSTWENNNNNSNSSPLSLISHKTNNLSAEDSDMDDDLFTVPDVETRQQQQPPMMNTTSTCPDNHQITNTNNNLPDHHGFQNQKRRRGRNPVDKEHRRLKRLLRNRVSAQQARERKKVYVNDLELRAKQLQDTNSKLEEKISNLLNENAVLRKVLLNTRPKVDQSIEQKHD